MAFTKKQRAEYNQHRERVGKEVGINKNQYNALRRVAQTLHRNDEDSAMGRSDWRHKQDSRGSKEHTEKDYNKVKAGAFKKAEALRKKIGGKHKIHFHHQTDPRGATLYVAKKRMKNPHSEGHVIY